MRAPFESQIERGFVASAHAASGGRQPGAVAASAAPLEASVVTAHPTPKPYSVEQADREARFDAVTDEPLADTDCTCGLTKLATAEWCLQCADEMGLIRHKGDKRDKAAKPWKDRS
jgi:hypothetical protein